MKIQQTYVTTLETSSAETVHGILNAKLEATSPESLTDYIGFSVGNIEDAIAKMDKATAELKIMKANAKSQIEMIKEQSAKWLSETGVSKLKGLRVSSITINQPADKREFKVLDEEFFFDRGFYTKELDETAIKKWIEESGEDTFNELYPDKYEMKTTIKQPTLKINKKRN